MDLRELNFLGPQAPPQGQLVTAQISLNQPLPESFNDPLYLVIPGWTVTPFFTLNSWPACHGETLPSPGDAVLLIRDDENNYRCIWWGDADPTQQITYTPSHLPGDLIASAASTRAGCLLCDGSSYSTTAYPALFAAIGYTYGGSGTSFNVPTLTLTAGHWFIKT